MSERSITLRQIADVFKGELAWMRIYPDGQRTEHKDCMSPLEIREALNEYGSRTVWRIFPGYGFIMVYLNR